MTRSAELEIFVQCLAAGKRRRCFRLIREWEEQKLPDEQLYEDILIPALVRFGEEWEQNRRGVVAEHVATHIIKSILAYKAFGIEARQQLDVTAMVGCVPDEHHDVASLIMANILEKEGWDVILYGSSVPRHDLIAGIGEHRPDLLCLTMKSIGCLESTLRLLNAVRSASPDTRIMLGGTTMPSIRTLLSEHVDAIADDFRSGARQAAELVGVVSG